MQLSQDLHRRSDKERACRSASKITLPGCIYAWRNVLSSDRSGDDLCLASDARFVFVCVGRPVRLCLGCLSRMDHVQAEGPALPPPVERLWGYRVWGIQCAQASGLPDKIASLRIFFTSWELYIEIARGLPGAAVEHAAAARKYGLRLSHEFCKLLLTYELPQNASHHRGNRKEDNNCY